ncbi:MAG: DNA polymerase Y family protein [Oxalobacteraceae bacterium]|nr:DNA polymerase Y family protein [Oxalobacteraceae bacterium]
MSEANAWSLRAGLLSLPRAPALELEALHEAALWALHFTPQVVVRDAGLLLDITASLRLFGGFDNLSAQLTGGIDDLGLHARMACAPTASAAQLLAHSAGVWQDKTLDEMLAPVPLAAIASARPYLDTLLGIGCHTLGQLRRMPRTGIARRFGNELLREIDRAYGDEAEVHAWFTAPASFDVRLELPAQVSHTDALLFAARRLLLQLTGWLNAHQSAISSITLWLHHEPTRQRDHRSTPVHIQLASASRDPAHLTLLLRERLGQVALIAPVIELSLAADEIVALASPNTELFPTAASQNDSIVLLVERLQSRLGSDAVRRLALVADHRPEKSYALLPERQSPSRIVSNALQASSPRPTWLLARPLALITRQHKPFYQSPLTLLAGPERIESGWWDDALALRDYFIAENEHHALLWIFRQRTTGDDRSDSGWFLHGYFG